MIKPKVKAKVFVFDTLVPCMLSISINPEKSPASLLFNGSRLSGLKLKRGAYLSLAVTILGVSSASFLRFGIKPASVYESSLLAYAEADAGVDTGAGTLFTLPLTVSSDLLDTALGVGSGNAELDSLSCMAEFSWQQGESLNGLSETLPVCIVNDVLRGSAAATAPPAVSYPSADAIATKSWTLALRAAAGQFGLVSLASDATLPQDADAVAVVQSDAGALVIPPASFSQRGGVRLGTERLISGSGVLPVGETTAGRLAVSAAGITAYALAQEAGFEGTLEEWLASLKGEPGEKGEKGEPAAPITIDDSPTENSTNALSSGAVFSALAGKASVEQLADHAALTASSTTPGHVLLASDTPISGLHADVALDSDSQLVVPMASLSLMGCVKKSSANGNSLSVIGVNNSGQMVLNVRTDHSGFEVSGNALYIQTSTSTHPDASADSTAPVATNSAGKLCVPPATTTLAGGVILASSIDDNRPSAVLSASSVADQLVSKADADELSAHIADTSLHLSSAERTDLLELLAKKDELLALLS